MTLFRTDQGGAHAMNGKTDAPRPSLAEKLKALEESRFHGNVTIHFANGKPKKIEYKTVEDLNN